MKKVILFLVLILCALSSFAVPLPDGSDARITEIRQSNGKIVSVRLKEVAILNTPLGALEAVEEVFFYENGSIKSFQNHRRSRIVIVAIIGFTSGITTRT